MSLSGQTHRCPRCGQPAMPGTLWMYGGECSECAQARARYYPAGAAAPLAVQVTHPVTGQIVLAYPEPTMPMRGFATSPASTPVLEPRAASALPRSTLVTYTNASASTRLEINVPPRPQVEILPRREVDEWLYSVLRAGPVRANKIRREAAARGYSWPRVKRAKDRLMVESEKLAWRKGWVWTLPFPD